MDAGGGGVLRRNRAAPASGAERLLVEETVLEAGSPWIGKIGSLKFLFKANFTRIITLLAVLVASKTGCRFVADASLLTQHLRNSFRAAETFRLGTLFLKRL
tara:strand:+ start:158 stop:463 length:306 start_codon:yes stop_codon:yes gene_type:complete